ncbi:MAG: hypothetical protein AVDCRST_MAG38-1240, partial [uncultured Solirubrobacteraceae bacterium]
ASGSSARHPLDTDSGWRRDGLGGAGRHHAGQALATGGACGRRTHRRQSQRRIRGTAVPGDGSRGSRFSRCRIDSRKAAAAGGKASILAIRARLRTRGNRGRDMLVGYDLCHLPRAIGGDLQVAVASNARSRLRSQGTASRGAPTCRRSAGAM